MATTYEQKCRRCRGTGQYANRGFCFRCHGGGIIDVTRYTPAEKAERIRYAARRTAAVNALHYGVAKQKDWQTAEVRLNIPVGFDLLEMNEPERFAKMLDSLEAGRVYDVAIALAAYAKSHTN